MSEILDADRRDELRALARTVNSVDDVHTIIRDQGLKADPGQNRSMFYYGSGNVGAQELSSKDGFVKLEQTERGYFLDAATHVLTTAGKVPRGGDENKQLFGDPDASPKTRGEWGDASKEFAELSKGPALAFPDPKRGAVDFQRTTFYNTELPAISANANVPSLTSIAYTAPSADPAQNLPSPSSFSTVKPAYVADSAYGVPAEQTSKLKAGEQAAPAVLGEIAGHYSQPRLVGSPMDAVTRGSSDRASMVQTSPAPVTPFEVAPRQVEVSPAQQRADRFVASTPEQRAADPELRNAQSQLTSVTARIRETINDPETADKTVKLAHDKIVEHLAAGAEFKPATVQETVQVKEAAVASRTEPEKPAREIVRGPPERER